MTEKNKLFNILGKIKPSMSDTKLKDYRQNLKGLSGLDRELAIGINSKIKQIKVNKRQKHQNKATHKVLKQVGVKMLVNHLGFKTLHQALKHIDMIPNVVKQAKHNQTSNRAMNRRNYIMISTNSDLGKLINTVGEARIIRYTKAQLRTNQMLKNSKNKGRKVRFTKNSKMVKHVRRLYRENPHIMKKDIVKQVKISRPTLNKIIKEFNLKPSK